MVRVDTIEEIKEKREIEKEPAPQKFSALDYTKAIASTLALDGGSIGNLIKNGKVGWLKYTENMSAGDLAKVIATLVIFTAAGNAKPTKSGAISFARSKGNKITPSFKEKVEKAVEKYNEQPRGKQLQGLQKIRQSSVDALTTLLKDTKNKADRQTIKGELAEAAKKLNETKENVKAEAKRNADEAAQVERIKEKVRQEKQKTPFEKKIDKRVAEYIRKKEAYDAKVAEIKKNNPNAFKTEVSAKTKAERQAEEMVDLFRDPKEVAKEQAEIARLKKEGLDLEKEKGLIDSEAKQAEGKESGGADSKASESKTEKPPSERKGSKGEPPSKTSDKAPSKTSDKAEGKTTKEQAKKQADKETQERRDKETKEVLEKSEREDQPNFDDEPTETEPLLEREREQTTDEMIDSEIELNRQEREASSIVSKAATAGTAATIATEVVNKLTNNESTNVKRRRNFEEDDEPGFTTETVKEGEKGTQSTNQPTPAPAPAPSPSTDPSNEESDTIAFNPGLVDVKQTIDVENVDDLFVRTLEFCELVYELDSFENGKYYKTIDIPGKRFILRDYTFPVLFNVSEGTLFIVFRGTSAARTYQEGISNFLSDLSTKKRVEDFLNKISSYEKLSEHLPERIAEIECHYGFLQELDKMYIDMKSKLSQLKNIKHIIVSGHSAGGALASLFSLIYSYDESIDDKKEIDFVITYGSPRWLFDNIEYKQLYDDAVPNAIRVWNKMDAVTYVPFHKPPLIPAFTETISGFIHTGQSFCLDGEYLNQNLNLLIENMIKNDNGQIVNIVKKLNPDLTSALMNYIISEDFENVISGGLLNCMRNSYIKPEVTAETIKVYNDRFRENFKEIESYADKCLELEPFNLMDLALNSNLKDTEDLQDVGLMSIFGITYNFFKSTFEAHFPPYYSKLLNELISEQEQTNKDIVSSKKDLLDDFKEEQEQEQLPELDQLDATYIINSEKILGYTTESNFQSGNIVEF